MVDTVLLGCELLEGLYPLEKDLSGSFRWSQASFVLKLNPPARHCALQLCYYGDSGKLDFYAGNEVVGTAKLHAGWQTCCVEMVREVTGAIDLTVSPIIPVETDTRELGVMIRRIEWFSSSDRFEELQRQIDNIALNHRERKRGQTELRSYPPRLRLTIEQKCNIYPRCVYCEWDWAKEKESQSGFGFSSKAFLELGSFFSNATEIVDCSYGEPFLNPNLPTILEELQRAGKRLEMTSNGQLMDPDQQRSVLGKDMILYVSLDTSNGDQYRHYRNEDFSKVVTHVRQLCRAKKTHGDLPTVVLSFIAMRSNSRGFGSFLDLARELDVDAVKVRALTTEGKMLPPSTDRAQMAFRYQDEVLDLPALREFTRSARRLAKDKGIRLFLDFEDFQSDREPDGPLCSEPWDSIYVLDRGVFPCCFGNQAVSTLDGVKSQNLSSRLRTVFNGPEYQEMRRLLARGELPAYCQREKSCPIVKQVTERETTRRKN